MAISVSDFVAYKHYYIPEKEDWGITLRPILAAIPSSFLSVAEAFKKNLEATESTACMPFRIASANQRDRLLHSLFMSESIRKLKPGGFKDQSEKDEADRDAATIAAKKFSEIMSSHEKRQECGETILRDLEKLLRADEMKLTAAELLRQAEVLAWGTLEALANDLFINLLNQKPQLTDSLLSNELTKKRFQIRDTSQFLKNYNYDLSHHMGDVFAAVTKIDDVDTLRAIYGVLMPNNSKLLTSLNDSKLWKLNQRRNLILHRRSIVDEMYLQNTGDTLAVGTELEVSPAQFESDLMLVLAIGSSMLEGVSSIV